MNLAEKVRQAGVVGAGGGGFPDAHQAQRQGRDRHRQRRGMRTAPAQGRGDDGESAAELVRGMQLAMEAVGAKEGVIGVKAKKKHAVEAVQAASKGTNVRVQLLGDYYPAGDEYDLVYNVTGKLIPPGGIPIAVGVVVNNVETFVNIAAAHDGRPLTHKTLTIAGAVKSPATMRVPIGMTFRECIEYAGGLTTDDPVLCLGGLMMGTTTDDLDTPGHENFHRRRDFAAHAPHH
jgi:Na+-translocating ferredoxin:NAD+ oxidoreductase RnfC subunit